MLVKRVYLCSVGEVVSGKVYFTKRALSYKTSNGVVAHRAKVIRIEVTVWSATRDVSVDISIAHSRSSWYDEDSYIREHTFNSIQNRWYLFALLLLIR